MWTGGQSPPRSPPTIDLRLGGMGRAPPHVEQLQFDNLIQVPPEPLGNCYTLIYM